MNYLTAICSGSGAGSYFRISPSTLLPARMFFLGLRSGVYELLHKSMHRFQGGLVFKTHTLLYHATLGLRVTKKKKFMVQREISTIMPAHREFHEGLRVCERHAFKTLLSD